MSVFPPEHAPARQEPLRLLKCPDAHDHLDDRSSRGLDESNRWPSRKGDDTTRLLCWGREEPSPVRERDVLSLDADDEFLHAQNTERAAAALRELSGPRTAARCGSGTREVVVDEDRSACRE